jgi:hypothetical protein
MQGEKCMMMHKRKRTNKSKKGIFLGRYIVAKGGDPAITATTAPTAK